MNLNRNYVGNSGAGNNWSKDSAAPKEGQKFSNLNSSIDNYFSLIVESFYVQDSDCTCWLTSYMCKDRQLFDKLTPIDDGSTFKMGIDEFIQLICGIEVVSLKFTSGKTI